MQLRRTVSKKMGNTFFTSLLFLFILATTLRVCTNKTMQECKLTNVFIQETQSYYLLENLMALTRDYAHQLTQNPMMPNLFLSVFAYRDKDKSSGKTGTIIDFNGSLSKEQIVPNDFPLQISSWDIKGGPIFWQDTKKDANDERYLAEVFMLGELAIDSKLVPNWKARIVQTMEIERNPLCDFQLYAEGDTLINGNISFGGDSWLINFYGPVQVNGNTRFQGYAGWVSTSTISHACRFYNRVNLAGHALGINEKDSSVESKKIPEKYCFYDNSDFYDGFTNSYEEGATTFYIKSEKLEDFSNKNSISSSYNNYEQYLFSTFKGNFMTRGRVYRPCGFDPISDWGYWYYDSSSKPKGGSSDNANILDMCLGLHNLCKSSANTYLSKDDSTNQHPLSDNTDNTASTATEVLRGLDAYQMTEKARLVETQKAISTPGLEVRLLLKNLTEDEKASLRVPISFPYVTYDSTHFPAKNDNLYLNYYLKLKFQGNSIFEDLVFYKNPFGSGAHYRFDNDDDPGKKNARITVAHKDNTFFYWQTILDNKLMARSVDFDERSKISDDLTSIFITQKGFDLVGYNDPSSPPHKLVEKVDTDNNPYWTLDSTKLRLYTSEPGYQFIYDRNRAKWIQLMDIDVAKLKEATDSGVLASTWASDLNRTIKINCYWQGHANNANCNYNSYDSTSGNTEDIRLNYASKRINFLESYGTGSYLYPSSFAPVIDIGVRLINAEELPEGGMTLICPYPLYIKGDFNTINMKPKACLITDSLTILSKDWQDWRSSMNFGTSYLYSSDGTSCDPYISPTTIYAHVITGRTHPHYWLKNNTTNNTLFSDFGIHDAFRTLEDISSPIKFYGSLLLPYYCQRQWEPPIDFAHASRSPSWFAYAPFYLGTKDGEWTKMRTAPGMPTYLKVGRGRKTQAIGSMVHDSLVNNILGHKKDNATNDDLGAYTFSDYHTNLPNFLKYPKDPE